MSYPLASPPITLRRSFTLIGAILCAGLAGACGSKPSPAAAPGPDVWATVDGRPIRQADVEKAYKQLAPTAAPSAEEAQAAKLNILNELIIQDLLIAKAKPLAVDVTDTEVETAFTDRKKNMTEDAFQKELTQRNLTAGDVKDGLRREMVAAKVIAHEVTAKITISDQDITDFFTANRAQFSFPETSYRIAQIVVTPVRDAEIANRANDDATTPEAADRKMQMLMERLKAGTAFSELAADYSEDPRSAPQGGDLGFVPLSALQQAPPLLRDTVLKMTPGSVSHVGTGGAHTLVLLVAKEEAGQRDPSMPAVKEGITNTLRGRREQLLRTAFLTTTTADATIVNYLARQIVQSQGHAGSAAPATAPAKP
ncbi:MAG: peptidylprolyl isomerase [Vicinamibacterales bacterium]